MCLCMCLCVICVFVFIFVFILFCNLPLNWWKQIGRSIMQNPICSSPSRELLSIYEMDYWIKLDSLSAPNTAWCAYKKLEINWPFYIRILVHIFPYTQNSVGYLEIYLLFRAGIKFCIRLLPDICPSQHWIEFRTK